MAISDQFYSEFLRKALGLHGHRLNRWFDAGLPYMVTNPWSQKHLRRILYQDWEDWIRANPEKIGGLTVDVLRRVLRDEELILKVSQLPRPARRSIAITRLTPTIQTFRSIQKAAEGCFITPNSLSRAVQIAKAKGSDRLVCGGFDFVIKKNA
jgi:hypothetical protein